MKQVWQKLKITCDSEEIAKQREVSLNRCERVKNVVRDGNVVNYEQITWTQEGYSHESREE